MVPHKNKTQNSPNMKMLGTSRTKLIRPKIVKDQNRSSTIDFLSLLTTHFGGAKSLTSNKKSEIKMQQTTQTKFGAYIMCRQLHYIQLYQSIDQNEIYNTLANTFEAQCTKENLSVQ